MFSITATEKQLLLYLKNLKDFHKNTMNKIDIIEDFEQFIHTEPKIEKALEGCLAKKFIEYEQDSREYIITDLGNTMI